MRVVLASLHPRAFSGQSRSLRALARALTATGDEVCLRTVAFPRSEHAGPLPGLMRYAACSLDLMRALSRDLGGTDIVHLNLPTPGFTFLADQLAAHGGAPVVVGYEAPLISGDLLAAVARDVPHRPGFYLPRLLVNNLLAARLARYRAGGYVVSSGYQRGQLHRLGVNGRVAVIPNVVDVPDTIDVERGRDDAPWLARERLGLPRGAPLVGYVGHFHPVKGVETLVRAFARLQTARPEARLVLAWSGLGNRASIASLLAQLGCASRTIWLGRIDLRDLLRALDVLALPYLYPIGQNAFPNVLLEVLSLGVPLISTRIPIIAEACPAPDTALLVPPGEPGALAATIGRLLEDSGSRERMAQRQRLRFAERFAPAALAACYHSLYHRVLGVTGHGRAGVAGPAETTGRRR